MFRSSRRSAFSLIELLVVVAIISILISILLPSLSAARKQARAVVCGANQKSIGQAHVMYGNENSDWICGVPFGSGLGAMSTEADWYLTKPDATVAWDWASPLMRYMNISKSWHRQVRMFDSRLGAFRCPENDQITTPWSSAGTPSAQGLSAGEIARTRAQVAQSYLTMWKMLLAGDDWENKSAGRVNNTNVTYWVYNSGWETSLPPKYLPKFDQVGNSSKKIYVMDGNRYFEPTGEITYNPDCGRTLGSGSYSATGPVYKFSVEYSEYRDASTVLRDVTRLSYRHGTTNKRGVQALFFDGHSEYLSERRSHFIPYTTVTGSTITSSNVYDGAFDGVYSTRVGANIVQD